MITNLIEALSYGFFLRALIVAVLLGFSCSLLGNFVVLRKEALITHTISSLAFLGIATGLILNLNIHIGMLVVGILGIFFVFQLKKTNKFSADSILELTAQLAMASAIILISTLEGYRTDLMQYLFGDILAISKVDLYYAIGLTILIILMFVLFHKKLMQITFSEELAKSAGINVNRINLVFMLLLVLTITLAIKIIGVILLSALLIIPANIGKQFARSFQQMTIYSAVAGLAGTVLGLFSSYIFDVPSGAMIILVLGAVLVGVNVLKLVFNKI